MSDDDRAQAAISALVSQFLRAHRDGDEAKKAACEKQALIGLGEIDPDHDETAAALTVAAREQASD